MKSNLEKNFISAVVYTKNDGKKLIKFLETISKTLSENFKNYEIIVVNDCSKDKTMQFLQDFVKQSKTGGSLSIVNMSYPEGVELSMNAGVDLAIGDFVYQFDTINIDYNPELIMETYYKSLEDNDIVAAVPKKSQRLTSNLFYHLFNKYSGTPERLTTESFMLVSRRAINRVSSLSMSVPYRKAVYANCGLKKATISYKPIESNKKSYDHKYRRDVAIDSLILFTNIAYRFGLIMSIIMMGVLIASGIYAIIVFIQGNAIAGWTTTMLLLSFAFLGLFVVSTIVIKYLSLITNLVFRKQTYVIKSIERKNI